jgi:hypothetical protein
VFGRFYDGLKWIKGIAQPNPHGRRRHKLSDPLGAGATYCMRIKPAFLPDQASKELNRQIVFTRRGFNRLT